MFYLRIIYLTSLWMTTECQHFTSAPSKEDGVGHGTSPGLKMYHDVDGAKSQYGNNGKQRVIIKHGISGNLNVRRRENVGIRRVENKNIRSGRRESLNGDLLKIPLVGGGDWQPCVVKEFCLCTRMFVYCSDGGRNLTYIPQLPPGTTVLYFMNNYLPRLDRHVFSNLTNQYLRQLIISNNSLTICIPGVFKDMDSLQVLEIANERLSSTQFGNCLIGMEHTQINEIRITLVDISNITATIFSGLTNSSVQILKLYGTNMNKYKPQMFRQLHKLRHLELVLCDLHHVHLWYSDTLETLILNHNRIMTFPNFCIGGRAAFPNLIELDLSFNFLNIVFESNLIRCMKKLNILHIGENPLKRVENNTLAYCPNLREVSILRVSNELFTIEPLAFNSSSIVNLDITGLFIDWVSIDRSIFLNCPNLNTLSIANNDLAFFTEEDFHQLLSPLTNLKVLFISFAGLRYLPRVISTHLTQLVELAADTNSVTGWPDDFFSPLTKLKVLQLKENHLTLVNRTSFPERLVNQLESIDFSVNPYTCSCDLLWFVRLLQIYNDTGKFWYYPFDFRCRSPYEVTGKDLAWIGENLLTARYCFLSSQMGLTLIASTSSLVLLVLFGSIGYRYRWNIKYIGYILYYQKRRYHRIAGQNDFQYDLYVSCSENDLDLVLDEIIPKLEDEMGFRLFIPERDAIGNKMDTIVSNMDASRKAILLLSNSYLQDHFCEFAARLAHERYLHEKTDFMVVVLLDEPGFVHVNKVIYNIVKTNEYIRWCGDDREGQRMFWSKLEQAVGNMDDLRE